MSKMVWRNMTAYQPRHCDRCGALFAHAGFYTRDSQSDECFAIVTCANCGLARTVFDQDWSALERYYGSAYYGEGEEGKRFIKPMEWLVARFREGRVRRILHAYPDAPGTILDVGCGRGLILQSLRARGWDCHGTELSETLAQSLARKGIHIYTQSHLPDANLPPACFDVVTLWHSLEHLPYPAQTLAEIARILKPGGKLLLEVPNLASWQAKVGRGRWFHIDAPRHLYHFTPDLLHRMLTEQGFTVTTSTTLSFEHGPYGMLQTVLNLLTTQNNVLYSLLRRQLPRSRGARLAWDFSITFMALPVLVIAGTLLELLASTLGRGAVIQLEALRSRTDAPITTQISETTADPIRTS